MMKTLLLEIMDHYRVAGLSFATGILVTLASSLIPAIWHCPTNPFLGQMVQLRKKRSRLASRPGGLSQFDLTDHYGLEQQVLNLDFNAQTMWMNVGFWKNNPQSLPEACQALLEEVLQKSGLLNCGDQPFSVLEVGCGCAEPARYLRKNFAASFDQYIGITLNGCQAEDAATRLAADCKMSSQSQNCSSKNRVYCADAAKPSSWPRELQKTVVQLITRRNTAAKDHPIWLLALDTLYHFTPDRKQILTYACQTLDASLMATDIIIADKISWLDRIKLRLVFNGLKVPWTNIMTRDQYTEMLVNCGYKKENITMIDITAHSFNGFDKFTQKHMEMWEAMGGSKVIPRAVRMMGWVMGWWARSGTVKEYVVIAKK
ncbi:hypothetical protein PDE_01073 [Penicillium oxalicum 114-2]|uniref:Methyltransferase domain-containing protein n=1 Tax=Penicillium oxalicum (strain 114-2 / CGMCC 5302) TaxID=933388 RepID=S8AW77_PENO1|nr:hypothetical protein PDE_01073 [Penicillium oxalicum 114-2]